MGRKRAQRPHGITRKKEIDKEVISIQLYTADKLVLEEDMKRTGRSRSEVIREVFHQHAMRKRFGALDSDEATIASTMKKLLTEVSEGRADIQSATKQTKELTGSVEGLTELHSTEFKRLSDLGLANFNLSAQVFTIVWAIVDFFQRYIANPLLSKMAEHKAAPQQESDRQIYEARTEGLQLVEKMGDDLRLPVKPEMVLIGASGGIEE